MLLKEEKSGHEKGNLKGNKRAGEITEKERSAERTAERLLGRSYRKGFYGGWSVFLFFAFVPITSESGFTRPETSSRISHGIWEEVRIFTILPTTDC